MANDREIHNAAVEQARREIASLKQQLAEAEAALRFHSRKIESLGQAVQRSAFAVASPNLSSAPETSGQAKVYQIARAVLDEAKVPLSTPEILTKARTLGFAGTGKSAVTTVYVAMKRRPEIFENIGNGKWKLR